MASALLCGLLATVAMLIDKRSVMPARVATAQIILSTILGVAEATLSLWLTATVSFGYALAFTGMLVLRRPARLHQPQTINNPGPVPHE